MQPTRIGDFLKERGVLTEAQIDQILIYAQETGLRFCEAGLELGILTRRSLVEAFAPGFSGDLFNLSSAHLPQTTLPLLDKENVIRFGALPLGYKRERRWFLPSRRHILNLGLLEPAAQDRIIENLRATSPDERRKRAFQHHQVYLVLIDQFLDVLAKVYGVQEADLKAIPRERVHPILGRFLHLGES